jgi:hypothetical protein
MESCQPPPMKKLPTLFSRILLMLVVGAACGFAAEKIAVVTAPNGEVFRDVRIVALKGDTASIVHSKGTATIPASAFDVEQLYLAKLEIDTKAAAAKSATPQSTPTVARPALVAPPKPAIAQPTTPVISEGTHAKLKAQLPTHSMAGSVDPMVRDDLVNKYTRSVAQIRRDNVPQNLQYLRAELDKDIAANEQVLATTKAPTGIKNATSSMRTVATANLGWLKSFPAHLARFENVGKAN